MSYSWIKFEKDLRTDPRVLRLASQLKARNAFVTLDRSTLVTLVLGALAQLWMLADTHVANDDLLPVGIDEINHVIGIEGFCQLIPHDWLQIIDANNVKLPAFHEHNGTIAKTRALTKNRVERHRLTRNAPALQPITHPVTQSALPDLDQDLDKKKKTNKRKIGTRLPSDFTMTAARAEYARGCNLDPMKTLEAFRDYWTASAGANAVKLDWEAAWRTWCRSPYNAPGKPGAVKVDSGNQDSVEWLEIKSHAAAIGFRGPHPLESLAAYRTDLRMASIQPAGKRPDLSALTAKLSGRA